MINDELNGKKIKALQLEAKKLKGRFLKIARKEWSPSNYGLELMVQISHLAHAISSDVELKMTIAPLECINKGTEDEIADVFFNVLNLANTLQLDLSSFEWKVEVEKTTLGNETSKLALIQNLFFQSGELSDRLLRLEGYKYDYSHSGEPQSVKNAFWGVLLSLIVLANECRCDLPFCYEIMRNDAEKYLDSIVI
jgi:NTP pyrophosphatase (non-canonical NTP hydrolase)